MLLMPNSPVLSLSLELLGSFELVGCEQSSAVGAADSLRFCFVDMLSIHVRVCLFFFFLGCKVVVLD